MSNRAGAEACPKFQARFQRDNQVPDWYLLRRSLTAAAKAEVQNNPFTQPDNLLLLPRQLRWVRELHELSFPHGDFERRTHDIRHMEWHRRGEAHG
jgi:hypothetical protein